MFSRSTVSAQFALLILSALIGCSKGGDGSEEGAQAAPTSPTAMESPAPEAAGLDWPQWRGPNRDGRIGASADRTWPTALELVWQVDVGGGYSSPVVAQGRVFVHERIDSERNAEGQPQAPGQEVFRAISAGDGSELWSHSVTAPFSQNQYATAQGAGPFSTPAVDVERGRVFSYGVNGVLEGRDVETGELDCSFVPEVPDTSNMFTGTAMSPLVLDGSSPEVEGTGLLGTVVVHTGDDRGGRIFAFSCDEEEAVWSWQGDGPGYASPVVMNFAGKSQIVTLTDRSLVGLDLMSGALLWRLDFPDEWNENIVTPVQFQDFVLVSGVRRGALAVRPEQVGGEWSATVVWERPERTHYMSSPVLLAVASGSNAPGASAAWVGLSNKRKGQLVALDPRTGADLWLGEGRFAESASLLALGNELLALTVGGELVVFRWEVATGSGVRSEPGLESEERADATAGLVEVARYTVANSAVWAHGALSGNVLLVRSADTLAAWRLPEPQ